jgi:hypothetical protein
MRAEISLPLALRRHKNALVLTKLISQEFNRVRVVLPVVENQIAHGMLSLKF